jgi:phosphinothricin acetyltransferase
MTTLIRQCTAADLPAVQAIYAHHVLNGTGTFEEVPPDLAEITARFEAVSARGLPWLVAEQDGAITGYAYAAPYRLRSAYRFTVENSVYVAPDVIGSGVGTQLMAALVDACEALGCRLMVAVIGDGANAASIRLHRALGFQEAGRLPGAGLKFGQWRDVVFMTLALGEGAATLPDRTDDPARLLA